MSLQAVNQKLTYYGKPPPPYRTAKYPSQPFLCRFGNAQAFMFFIAHIYALGIYIAVDSLYV